MTQQENDKIDYNGSANRIEELLDTLALIFRLLWISNLAAAAFGIYKGLYVPASVAMISYVLSLLGAAALRRIMKHLADLGIRYRQESQ